MIRLFPHVAGIFIALAALFGAYHHGVRVTTATYEGQIERAKNDSAQAILKFQTDARDAENRHQQELATIADQHQKEIENEQNNVQRTVADLRSGALRLRDSLAASCASDTSVSYKLPSNTASAGVNHGPETVGLQQADAEFLVRLAAEADAVTDQLRACQAVVRADRSYKTMKE